MKILVPEAHAMGSIACIRSLGRAGHHIVGLSADPDALGFRSNWCHEAIVQPAGQTPEQARAWLLALILSPGIDLVLPSEGLASTLGPALAQVGHKLPVGPDPTKLLRFMQKFDLFELFMHSEDEALRRHLPPTALLRAGEAVAPAVASMQGPLFAKFDAVAERQLPSRVIRYDDAAEACAELPALLDRYGQAVLQSFVPGHGVGVFFLRWGGRIVGSLMHRRLHEVPHTGGVSSYRETWWDEALHEDARRRIEAMDWWGVGMIEYRYEDAERFHLMEFNARFWGSLHLALFAGADLPDLLVRAHAGEQLEPVRARPGVRCRYTFPKDVEHLWSVLKDHELGFGRKAAACAEFAALSFDPSVHSDLWFPGDRGLYARALWRTPMKFLGRG